MLYNPPENSKIHYQKCKKEILERNKKYHQEHKEEIMKYQEKYHKEHIEKWKYKPVIDLIKKKKWSAEVKEKVLTHYGNGEFACVICSESRSGCLSIDHIDGNGGKHRKELKKIGVGSGTGFYRWLIKNNFPEGYRTLCMNCQFIEKERKKE